MKSEFEKIVKEKLTSSKISPDIVIQSMKEFYENHKAPPTHFDAIPEDDMLLFKYGTYDRSGAGHKFEFNLTRQITIPDVDEFYQFSLTISFESNVDTSNVEAYSLWSIDYESMESWVAEIKGTKGYHVACIIKPLDYNIELSQT